MFAAGVEKSKLFSKLFVETHLLMEGVAILPMLFDLENGVDAILALLESTRPLCTPLIFSIAPLLGKGGLPLLDILGLFFLGFLVSNSSMLEFKSGEEERSDRLLRGYRLFTVVLLLRVLLSLLMPELIVLTVLVFESSFVSTTSCSRVSMSILKKLRLCLLPYFRPRRLLRCSVIHEGVAAALPLSLLP